MKWCCIGFESAYHEAGKRSIAVLIDKNLEGEPAFFLQARAFDGVQEPEIRSPATMSLVIQTGMRFCPWCGVSLEKWYGKYFRELIRPGFRIDSES
jgi:hypothetical protein